MNVFDQKKLIAEDPDFIALRRFDYSLVKLMARYPDGCPDKTIAAALLIPEEEVEELYQKAVARLRIIMGVTD